MKSAKIENGKVVNIVLGSLPDYIECDDSVAIGDLYSNGVFSKPPPAPTPVPEAVTMRQARIALLQAGKLATVNSTIAAMPGVQGDAARIEWEFSSEVKRNQPLVLALAPVLGMTSGEIDQLFITAAGL